jgi:hypothetical protein
MQGAYIGKSMGRAKERPPQFPSQYGSLWTLRPSQTSIWSPRTAVYADGCASARRRCSVTSLIVQSEQLQSAALRGDLVDVEQLTRLANLRRAPFYWVGGQ